MEDARFSPVFFSPESLSPSYSHSHLASPRLTFIYSRFVHRSGNGSFSAQTGGLIIKGRIARITLLDPSNRILTLPFPLSLLHLEVYNQHVFISCNPRSTTTHSAPSQKHCLQAKRSSSQAQVLVLGWKLHVTLSGSMRPAYSWQSDL